MSGNHEQKKGVITFLYENSIFLIGGSLLALAWANVNSESYKHFGETVLFVNDWIGHLHDGHREFTLHYLINDVLMAIFFAIAGKEVREAMLPGGVLNDPKAAATPLIGTIGGMVGPASIFLLLSMIVGRFDELYTGWAIPCATDIAFSYLIAKVVFGPKHPAIPVLLLIAIADDALGLIILVVAYPQEELRLAFMLLPVLAMAIGFAMNKMKVHSFWPYLLIAGPISWLGFALSGLHPALGLLPIIPTMPHAHTDLGIWAPGESEQDDTLNRFEHWWKRPTELILGAFGLLNAGVAFGAMGDPTWIVAVSLLVGKIVFITGFSVFAAKVLGFGMPKGVAVKDIFVISCAASIGFTVALFVAGVAYEKGPIQDAAKMGALFSFAGVGVTWIAAKLVGVEKLDEEPTQLPAEVFQA